MFRVPLRSTSLSAAALPRPSYDTRRQLVGVMHGRNGWSPNGGWPPNGRPSAGSTRTEPAFRSPWGELERQIPYVIITTQPFPAEWWTPPSLRAAAVARATSDPIDLIARRAPRHENSVDSVVRIRIGAAQPRQIRRLAPVLAADPTETPRIQVHATTNPLLEFPAFPRGTARSLGDRGARGRQRRGFLARLAVVALGLVISLIAVESATRRRP